MPPGECDNVGIGNEFRDVLLAVESDPNCSNRATPCGQSQVGVTGAAKAPVGSETTVVSNDWAFAKDASANKVGLMA